MADQPADDSGQFHGGYAQQGWPPNDAAQKPAFYNPQQMPATSGGPPMFFNPASFDTGAAPPFLAQQGPAHPPQQQWDNPPYPPQQQQPTWNSHEVQNGPPHQGGYQGGGNVQQNEYPQQQPYPGWQDQDLYTPPVSDPLTDSRASSSFYESSGQSSTLGLGFSYSSENPSLNSSERTSPMLAGGDYGQGHGFPYDGTGMDIPRDGMQQQPPAEGAAMFRQPEGNSLPNDSGPGGQYFSGPGNTNTAASVPQVSMFTPQFGLPEESRSAASLGQEEGEVSLTRELTGQEQSEENIQQFPPQPQNTQLPPVPNLEGSQTETGSWDFGGAPHQEIRRELTGQEDGLDSQPPQDPAQFASQPSEPLQQAPPMLSVEEPTTGIPTPSPGHSRSSSQQFDTISLGSGKEGNPSRSGSRASSLIVEGQAQPGVTPGGSNSGTREEFDVGTRPVGDHSRSGSVDSVRSAPGIADGPPQGVAQTEPVGGTERSRSGSAESGRSARSSRSGSGVAPPAPPLNVPYQEGAAMERSRSGSAESGRSGGSGGRPPSLSRHSQSNDSIHSAGSNPALSSQPPLLEEQSPGDGAPSPQPGRPSDVGPGDSPEGAASPDEPTQPQQGDGEPEPPPQNTRPPQARPSGHSPPPPSRPSIPNFPIFSPMEGSMAPQFPFASNFPNAGPSMPSPIQHSASSPFQPVATRPQPFPARTEHNGFPGEGQDSTPTSGNDNSTVDRQDREAPQVARQPSREEHHQHGRENHLERELLPRREDMRNEPRERRTSGQRDGAEGEQSVPPPPMPAQPHPAQSHHGVHPHHRKQEERRESTPTASLWASDVPASVPSVILAPAAPPTLTQAPSVQPHPVPMFVPAPNLPSTMQGPPPLPAASPPEKQQQPQQPSPASAIPSSSAFGTPLSTAAASAPVTSASTPSSQQSPQSTPDTYRNASAPPPDSTNHGAQQTVPPASTQSYSTPPSRQTSTASNSSYTSQSGRPAEERTQERRNPQEGQPSPSRSPRQVAGNESEPDDRYGQRTQPQKPAGQATQQADTRRDVPPPSTQSNQQPSDTDYTRTRDYRGREREGDTSYSAQEPERPSSRSSNHGGDRDWDRDKDDRYYDRRDSWYDQRDRRYDSRRDYYQERDYRSRSYEQDPRYSRQGSYDSYYGRQESRDRERPSSRQERERPSSRQGDRPRSRQDYDREAYYRQYSADYDRSGYYDQEKYRRRRDYYGREYDSRGQRDPRYSRERGSQRSKSVDNSDYWANDPRYQEWYNYYYGRHGNSYDPRYYEYYKQQMQQQQQQQQQSQGYDLYAYDPRYDNTYDDENCEDDRRSVHSNASGHSSHSHQSQGWGGQYDDRFARDFHRDSGHGDTSAYGHNGGYGDNSWYRDSWQQGQTPAARTTPAKFHIPHVLARFGPGGHMIKVLPNNPADGMPAVVEVHALETLLVNNTEVEEFRVFPGPLIKGVTHKSDVIRFCQDKAAASLASTELRDKESAALLWQLLELLCRQNGTIVGTDIAELLLQGHPSMAYPQRTEAEGEDRGSQGDLSQASTTSDGTVGGTEAADIERLTQKFRELLLFGRKKDALEWAMKGGLWGHALLLASKMDSRAHANVMTRFANSLPMNDPLQTLYQLMSHRQPAAVTSCADERWGDWRPHLAMVLSNHTQRPEVDRKSIITLGDTLGSRGLLHAAHFCYLMAQVNFGHYSKKASKMVLLGSSHSLPFMEFASNEAIQMTEVYEYAMTLGNAAHYILPSFQEYKFLYATRLAECGMTAQALTYCECIVSAVERAPTSFSSTLISQLHQLSERLFWHDPHFSSLSAEEDQDYDWINSIRYMNQQVLEGALLPSSASDTPMFVGSTEPSIDGTSTPTPGETTFTGVGTPQYDPNQQEQYEGYNASGIDPAAYQQQGGTDSPYQQYQQQQQMDPNASYQPWSKPVPADMNLMASMNSEYSTTSATTDGGTETENDVPDYYDQMAGQVRMVQQQHRGTPDSQGSQSRLRALSGSSHASTTRARSMSGSSQLSHGSQRIRRRQRTTSESSQVDIKEEPAQKKQEKVPNSRQASAKPKDSNISSQSHQGQKTSAQRSGGTSWLGGLFTKMMRGKNEIHLPDDTNKSIVWDATRNKWVNQDEGEEEDAAPPPPPPKDPMPSPAGGPAPPPGNTPNRFSRRAGPTGKYVDVLNQSGTTKPAAPPPDLFPGLVPTGNAMPNLFVPAAVPTSDANEPQGSQLQGTTTQGDPQGTHAPTQVQQQPPMFYNPNEPMTSAAQVPPTSTPNSQAQLSRSSSMSSMSYEVSHLLKAQQPQDSAGPPAVDQGVAPPPQAVAAPPMFFNPSSFSAQNSPFNSPAQGPTGLGSRPRYARPR